MQVFLIRHPPPQIAAGICYGRLDVDCIDPEDAARRLRPQLPPDTPVLCSPLRRALRLALALDPQARSDPRLAEIDFGAWEGRAWEAIARPELDAWAADVLHFTPPGGESVASLQQRALSLAAELRLPRVALVTHAGIMRALVGHWRRLPPETWTRLDFAYGSLTAIDTGVAA